VQSMQRQQTKVANSKFHLDVRILVYEIQETLETREATSVDLCLDWSGQLPNVMFEWQCATLACIQLY
jgi:hypothetical protein